MMELGTARWSFSPEDMPDEDNHPGATPPPAPQGPTAPNSVPEGEHAVHVPPAATSIAVSPAEAAVLAEISADMAVAQASAAQAADAGANNTDTGSAIQPVSISQQIEARISSLTAADKSSDFYSIYPPSNFEFYPFKSLSTMEIKGRHQAKINKAATNKNTHYLVEAVTSLLGDGVNAYDLTPEDFWWVLYWLLISSYPNKRHRVTVTCGNVAHVAKVEEGLLSSATLRSLHEYSRPTLDERILDVEATRAVDTSVLDKAGYKLTVLTMRQTLDWEDTYGKMNDDELYYLQDLATVLDPAAHGSLEDRVVLVANMSVAELDTLKEYKDAVTNYGVEAYIKHTCKECGAETVSKIAASASDFL